MFWLRTLLLLCLFAGSSHAATYKLNPSFTPQWKRATFTFGFGLSAFALSNFALKVPAQCAWCEPSEFERNLSTNTIWSDRSEASTYSNIITYGLMPGLSALVAFYDWEQPSETLLNVFTLLNTALVNYSFTEALKRGTARARPQSVLGYAVDDVSDEYLSFPSGHTSAAFALATASSWMAFKRRDHWAPFVVFLGGMSALGTGYLRIAAGKHWFSDVMAGAAVGIFTGSVVPLFTFAQVTPMPGAHGVMLNFDL